MEIRIRKGRAKDIEALKDRLRGEDVQEVLAAGNESVEYALRQSYERSSICFCVDIDDSPCALFGIVPDSLLGHSAHVWMLGAKEMSKIKKTFLKESRRFILRFLEQYPCLWNIVDARYTSSIRWLIHCGALFDTRPIVIQGVRFFRFEIRRV